MNTFNKHILFILLASTFWLVGPGLASAQSPLSVLFETTPLFANADFKPLDTMTRWVRVTNVGNARPVIFEAINKTGCLSGPYCLADRLRIQIYQGPTLLYDQMLSVFYADGEVIVDPLLPAETTRQYDVKITFETGPDDNNYQILQTGFDLLVGFQGPQTNTSTGSEPAGLLIQREISSVATSSGGILINWTTSFPATSQVLYGLASGGPYTLNLSLPNYGYPFATPENSTKVTNHSVLVTGLTPGATYRYRVVSHASPPTVGYEFEFTVPEYSDSLVLAENPKFFQQITDVPPEKLAYVEPGISPTQIKGKEGSATSFFASTESGGVKVLFPIGFTILSLVAILSLLSKVLPIFIRFK